MSHNRLKTCPGCISLEVCDTIGCKVGEMMDECGVRDDLETKFEVECQIEKTALNFLCIPCSSCEWYQIRSDLVHWQIHYLCLKATITITAGAVIRHPLCYTVFE